MDIVQFINDRLDEDEAAARALVLPAHDGYHPHPELSEWRVGDDGEVEYVAPVHKIPLAGGRVGYSTPTYVTMDNEGLRPSVEPDVAHHIARHDPARVLREVHAKRAIVDLHANWPVLVERPMSIEQAPSAGINDMAFRASQQIAWLTTREYVRQFGGPPPTAPMIRELAAVYADHEDYNPEWR